MSARLNDFYPPFHLKFINYGFKLTSLLPALLAPYNVPHLTSEGGTVGQNSSPFFALLEESFVKEYKYRLIWNELLVYESMPRA